MFCLELSLIAATLLAQPAVSNPPKENSAPWEEVEDDDGIKVWARAVPGSNVREVKAEAEFDVDVERIWSVIMDVEKYIEFMPYLEELKIIGTEPDGSRYEYQRIDPPFVDRRDYTLQVRSEIDKAQGIYKRMWSPAPDKGPKESEDVVRLRICNGSWTLKALGPKKTKVVYWLYTDPGGSIPAWMANRANNTSIPTLVDAVRQRSKDPNFKRD